MKLLIDFITKLSPEFESYRSNIFQALSGQKELDIYIATKEKESIKGAGAFKQIYFGKNFHWNKDCEHLKKLKPDSLLVFSSINEHLMRKYPAFVFLEPIIEKAGKGQDVFHLSESKLKGILNKLKYAKGIIVRTKYMQVYLANHYAVEKNNIFAIGQGIDPKFFRKEITDDTRIIRQVLSIYRVSKPYIFVSGRLNQKANLDKALEVFSGIHQKHPDLKLLIASTDFDIGWDNKPRPLNKAAVEILELCERYRITRKVVFTGLIDTPHIPILLDNAELVLQLEEKQNISKSLLEALAAGTPLIINDSPTFKELASNAAIITTPKVTNGVVNAVQFILDNENERERMRKKAEVRSEYFTWQATAQRLTDYLLVKNKVKAKESLLIISSRNNLTPASFESQFKCTNENIYKYTNNIRKFLYLMRLIKKQEYILIKDDNTVSMAFYMMFFRIVLRNSYFIYFVEQEHGDIKTRGFFYQFLKKISAKLKGIYIKIVYKKIIFNNPFCIKIYSRRFGLNENKAQYLPIVFDKKLNKSKSVVLRNKARLKNYLCIAARIDDAKTWNYLQRIANDLYAEFQEFKVLVIKDPGLVLPNTGGKKIQKRFLFFTENEVDEVLLNSKIYFDFRDKMSQYDLLTAMKARNCCIVKSTPASLYLIKPGINGYVYSSLETDKIQKQITILFNNKVHLNDIRRVNALRPEAFTKENVDQKLKEISGKWN